MNEKDWKFYGLKSHDCHIFMQRLLPIAFCDLFPLVWEAISELSVFFRDIYSIVLSEEHTSHLEKNILDILCKLEKIFPPSFFDVMEISLFIWLMKRKCVDLSNIDGSIHLKGIHLYIQIYCSSNRLLTNVMF